MGNKEDGKVYLMLRGHNSCPDADEIIGIFDGVNDNFQKIYMESFLQLKDEQQERRYLDFSIQIYEFRINERDEGTRVSP